MISRPVRPILVTGDGKGPEPNTTDKVKKMITFNHLATKDSDVKRSKKRATPKQNLKVAADLGMVWPPMSKADAAKCRKYINGVKRAVGISKHGQANSAHWKSIHGEYKNLDEIATLANHINRLTKMNAAVFDGGEDLKSALIELGWLAYAKLEYYGLDNAHYQQADLPCDERGRENIYDVRVASKRKRSVTAPESSLPAESQWLALEIADAMTQPSREPAAKPHYPEPTPCRLTVEPTRRDSWEWITQRPEPMTGGQGSGLPFEVKAEPEPEPYQEPAKKTDPERFDMASRYARSGYARLWCDNSPEAIKARKKA